MVSSRARKERRAAQRQTQKMEDKKEGAFNQQTGQQESATAPGPTRVFSFTAASSFTFGFASTPPPRYVSTPTRLDSEEGLFFGSKTFRNFPIKLPENNTTEGSVVPRRKRHDVSKMGSARILASPHPRWYTLSITRTPLDEIVRLWRGQTYRAACYETWGFGWVCSLQEYVTIIAFVRATVYHKRPGSPLSLSAADAPQELGYAAVDKPPNPDHRKLFLSLIYAARNAASNYWNMVIDEAKMTTYRSSFIELVKMSGEKADSHWELENRRGMTNLAHAAEGSRVVATASDSQTMVTSASATNSASLVVSGFKPPVSAERLQIENETLGPSQSNQSPKIISTPKQDQGLPASVPKHRRRPKATDILMPMNNASRKPKSSPQPRKTLPPAIPYPSNKAAQSNILAVIPDLPRDAEGLSRSFIAPASHKAIFPSRPTILRQDKSSDLCETQIDSGSNGATGAREPPSDSVEAKIETAEAVDDSTVANSEQMVAQLPEASQEDARDAHQHTSAVLVVEPENPCDRVEIEEVIVDSRPTSAPAHSRSPTRSDLFQDSDDERNVAPEQTSPGSIWSFRASSELFEDSDDEEGEAIGEEDEHDPTAATPSSIPWDLRSDWQYHSRRQSQDSSSVPSSPEFKKPTLEYPLKPISPQSTSPTNAGTSKMTTSDHTLANSTPTTPSSPLFKEPTLDFPLMPLSPRSTSPSNTGTSKVTTSSQALAGSTTTAPLSPIFKKPTLKYPLKPISPQPTSPSNAATSKVTTSNQATAASTSTPIAPSETLLASLMSSVSIANRRTTRLIARYPTGPTSTAAPGLLPVPSVSSVPITTQQTTFSPPPCPAVPSRGIISTQEPHSAHATLSVGHVSAQDTVPFSVSLSLSDVLAQDSLPLKPALSVGSISTEQTFSSSPELSVSRVATVGTAPAKPRLSFSPLYTQETIPSAAVKNYSNIQAQESVPLVPALSTSSLSVQDTVPVCVETRDQNTQTSQQSDPPRRVETASISTQTEDRRPKALDERVLKFIHEMVEVSRELQDVQKTLVNVHEAHKKKRIRYVVAPASAMEAPPSAFESPTPVVESPTTIIESPASPLYEPLFKLENVVAGPGNAGAQNEDVLAQIKHKSPIVMVGPLVDSVPWEDVDNDSVQPTSPASLNDLETSVHSAHSAITFDARVPDLPSSSSDTDTLSIAIATAKEEEQHLSTVKSMDYETDTGEVSDTYALSPAGHHSASSVVVRTRDTDDPFQDEQDIFSPTASSFPVTPAESFSSQVAPAEKTTPTITDDQVLLKAQQEYDFANTYIGRICLQDFFELIDGIEDGRTTKVALCEAYVTCAELDAEYIDKTYSGPTNASEIASLKSKQVKVKLGNTKLLDFLKQINFDENGNATAKNVRDAFYHCAKIQSNASPSKISQLLEASHFE